MADRQRSPIRVGSYSAWARVPSASSAYRHSCRPSHASRRGLLHWLMASQKWLSALQDNCPSTRASQVSARGASGIGEEVAFSRAPASMY